MDSFSIFIFLLFALPIISFIWFVVRLVKFIRSKNEPARRGKDKIFLIFSVLTLACSTGAVVGFLWLLDRALAHM
ncbi:hypothetical protein [Campylobacter gracilis]|uniref:Uncharacterized protein n=1 Tax=Campylobacter gracilis RM3268 TaxID=553220 RepID=C8PE15_9BACT|nr:hypothetical protein [Campylobacter gracilis]AKT92762.1 putative membrane protein [Campylobacter gracilis]EEV18888.1 hypothetical protein CAMGR0001_2365 [Campylobacter gracilis RM3268]UEB45064.1 hypothetical protein LK410_08685 [Campylobacter gracilis]SUW82278.1 Uncharacterised protein [Campylobacter gracilis]